MIKRLLKELFKTQLSKQELINDTIKHLKNKEFTRMLSDGKCRIGYKRTSIKYDNIFYPRINGDYPGLINYLRLIKPLCKQLDYLELQDLQDILTGKNKENEEECSSQIQILKTLPQSLMNKYTNSLKNQVNKQNRLYQALNQHQI